MSYDTTTETQTDNATQAEAKSDIYSRITNKIIADLEKGELTWRKPWSSETLAGNITRPLRHNDVPYSGINVIVLWATAAERDYTSPYWMTFQQAQEMKAHVKKGEKSTTVVYANKMIKEEENKKGETATKTIPYLKCYPVFNASQIEGLPPTYYALPEPAQPLNPEQRNAELDVFFAATKATILPGPKASYNETLDRIQMPPFESFVDARSFYATQAHELVHWTKHRSRLDRELGKQRMGDAGYAKEELVAELGSCFLAADLGLEPEPLEDHAAYIQSWLKALQDDKRLIFSAAGYAQRAVEYLHHLQA